MYFVIGSANSSTQLVAGFALHGLGAGLCQIAMYALVRTHGTEALPRADVISSPSSCQTSFATLVRRIPTNQRQVKRLKHCRCGHL